MIIWLPVALLSWVELQQVGAAVVVASVVAAVGHRNLRRRVVRSGGQKVTRLVVTWTGGWGSPGYRYQGGAATRGQSPGPAGRPRSSWAVGM